jgi:hypothetical protein
MSGVNFPPRENAGSSGGGSDKFFRIKDGEMVNFVLKGPLHTFYQKGFGQLSQIVGPGEGGKQRFRQNVIVKDGNGFAVKIWEFGTKLYDTIAALQASGWDLNTTQLTLSRKGSTKENTTYTLTPIPKPISAAAAKEIEKLELHSLEHKPTQASQDLKEYSPGSDDEVPF